LVATDPRYMISCEKRYSGRINLGMTINSFGRVTASFIVFTAFGFLLLFACDVPATPPLMVPWSAITLSIAGLTLWFAPNPLVERFGLHRAVAILVFAIGTIVCGEHIAHAGSTAVDRLIFGYLLPQNIPLPGRPAELVGFQYCLMGCMLFLMRTRSPSLVLFRELAAVAVVILCYFGFVAVLSSWGANASQSISSFASVLELLAAANVLVTAPKGSLAPLLCDSGPAGMIARRLMPVPLILPAVTLIARQLVSHVPVDEGRGTDAILFDSLNILAAIMIVWIAAAKVLSVDLLRRTAEENLRASRDNLDHRVRLRTQELLDANERLAVEVSDRQLAENKLQAMNAMLASIIEACPLAIIALNLDRSVRRSNAAANSMHLAENLDCRDLADRASSGEPVHAREVVCELEGKTIYLNVWASPMLTHDACPDGVVMMAADVSESKTLEAHVQQNQRLESIGVLAGGIAHDFNNLLTGVLGNASLLQERVVPSSREAAAAADLIAAGQVMAKLTSQMLAYSGRGRFQIQSLDLSAEVRQITNLLQASIPKNVRLRLALADGLSAIEGDSSQIQQVVMNLVINGAEAAGSRQGVVEVRTLSRRAEQSELSAAVTRPAVAAGEFVVLEVCDSGAGMDEKTRTRIFDPFFTAKFSGRGLGLSAVLGIVRAHRGALVVQSSPGAGSTFRLFFPRATAFQAREEPQWIGSHRGSGTILIVDDEKLVLGMARSVLDYAGYEVLCTSNGSEALDIYAARSGQIDAIVLDMTMPVLSGEETMERLAARWPDATVIATSGYDLKDTERRFTVRPAAFLQKPYTAAQLTSKVAEVVRSRPAHPGSAMGSTLG
jgi:signal transduction histidine kinase/ActR/RegA family two-component response regulator